MRHADQAWPLEVGRPLQRACQLRRADRHQVGGKQRLRRQSRPVAIAEPHAAAPVVAERHGGPSGGDAHVDVGLLLAEIGEPRDQPFHQECRADADGQHAHARRRRDLRGQACQRIEDRRQPALIGLSRRGHHQPVGLALEQRDAEPLFQQMHHAADRGGRDVEFAARRGKAAAARRRLECLDAVEKEQPPQNRLPSGKLMPGQDNSVCAAGTSEALIWRSFEFDSGALLSFTSPRLRGEVGSHR